ncbi:dihydrofolate reductase family protein [Photobacterium sp. TY1-4]|uniref:dihydrofolate reductase family protein n=1 Tax=Photobacterium sp. TY1-4 TaxID=2899122 RepID=UPI0021C128DE|nr:dihydrofolate reductase family protein [Photobacterium sp. TY1-4]UXI03900.1 dihydrofolate reductase family protein [Photobacterium sp. TY1-4]
MKVSAYMAQSLDGYIAGPNGELDWLEDIENPEGSDFGFAEFMSTVDALLMGKHTFEKVASFGFWPYDKPVYVASNSLTSLPEELEDKVTIVSGSLSDMLAQLESRNVRSVYVDGGQLIQSALRHGVLREITVTTMPVILGDGISLFGPLESKVT